jgi:hypothetical protein
MTTRSAGVLALIGCSWLGFAVPAPTQSTTPSTQNKVTPKLEAFAETKLLMEGLAQANFRGLERILSEKPKDNQAWTFARGQALLLAETGNLLMLRPPRNQGEAVWFQRAMDFRTQALQLAQVVSQKDHERSKKALITVANTCNRCHQTFRVPIQMSPFEAQPLQKVHLP